MPAAMRGFLHKRRCLMCTGEIIQESFTRFLLHSGVQRESSSCKIRKNMGKSHQIQYNYFEVPIMTACDTGVYRTRTRPGNCGDELEDSATPRWSSLVPSDGWELDGKLCAASTTTLSDLINLRQRLEVCCRCSMKCGYWRPGPLWGRL